MTFIYSFRQYECLTDTEHLVWRTDHSWVLSVNAFLAYISYKAWSGHEMFSLILWSHYKTCHVSNLLTEFVPGLQDTSDFLILLFISLTENPGDVFIVSFSSYNIFDSTSENKLLCESHTTSCTEVQTANIGYMGNLATSSCVDNEQTCIENETKTQKKTYISRGKALFVIFFLMVRCKILLRAELNSTARPWQQNV